MYSIKKQGVQGTPALLLVALVSCAGASEHFIDMGFGNPLMDLAGLVVEVSLGFSCFGCLYPFMLRI